MRVVLDGTPLSMSSGGLRRYTEQLCQALQFLPDTEATLIQPQGRFWWSVGLPRELRRMKADVFHGTNFEVPYLPACPAVLTLHDLSPWKNPEWHHAATRVRRRTPALLRLRLATMVITPSEAIRRESVARFPLPLDRVVTVPEAAASHFMPAGTPRGNYFLFAGTVEPRKGILDLVQAWREVRLRHSVDLVIAGRHRADAPPIPIEPGIRVLGEVPEDSLAGLYSSAIAVVYPSMYEGFGLPVLEAMQCGTPVITTRDAALTEVSGGAALHVEGTRSLAAAMEMLILDPERREEYRNLGIRRAAEFSWERTAQLTREVYAEAIRRWRF